MACSFKICIVYFCYLINSNNIEVFALKNSLLVSNHKTRRDRVRMTADQYTFTPRLPLAPLGSYCLLIF